MPIADAVRFFDERGRAPLLSGGRRRGRLLGLVSRSDALRWQVDRTRQGTLAEALSDASTEYAFPETPTAEVADMMVESGVGRVPIVDHERRVVVGIISRQDLLKVRVRHKHAETVRTRGVE